MWDESIPHLVGDLFEQNGPHGGPKETAMILHVARDLVHEDRLEEARDGGLVDWESDDGARVHGARTFYDSIENTGNGVLGDQTDATPEKGEQLFKAATEQLVKLCDWVAGQPTEDLMPRAHV
jgi:creatinine amidohydrolase